ncbi:hypothetical protein SEF58_10680 [Neomoorella humiferrea]|uniref:hypothetical protein n=1 Tax=Neomoorella humiferrea TaxID=676965 RepID=UPI003D8DA56F
MGELHVRIEQFLKTRSPELLREILNHHGKYGFSLACHKAGISRGKGKRMIGIYNDDGAIRQIAARVGYSRSKPFI